VQGSRRQEYWAADAGGPRAEQASKLEARLLLSRSEGGTVARAGRNACAPLSAHAGSIGFSQDVRPMRVVRTPSWRLLMPRRRWTASKPRLTRCLLSFSEDRDRRLCGIQVRAKRGREAFRLPVLSGLRRRRKNDTNHVHRESAGRG